MEDALYVSKPNKLKVFCKAFQFGSVCVPYIETYGMKLYRKIPKTLWTHIMTNETPPERLNKEKQMTKTTDKRNLE